MQLFMITCYLFGTVFSASLFGLDFSTPKKVMRTRVDEISRALRPNNKQHPDSPGGLNNQPINKENSCNTRDRNSFRALLPAEIAEMFKPQEPPKSINKPTLERNQTTAIAIPIKDGGAIVSGSKPASSGSKNASVPLNLTGDSQPPIAVKDGEPISSGSKPASSGSKNASVPLDLTGDSQKFASSSSKNAYMPPNLTEETQTTDAYDQADSFFTIGWSDNGTEYYTSETSEYETTTDEPLNRIGGVPPGVLASILGGG